MHAVASGTLASLGGRPVRWAATGRLGGVSTGEFAELNLADHVGDDPLHVAANRGMLVDWADGAGLAVIGAEHGGRVQHVVAPGVVPGVDGLVASAPDLALLALAADCVPLVLADPERGVIGAAHCGWRGLVAGIVANTVQAMRAAGAERIHAVVGPSICADCYPVPAERIAIVRGALAADAADVVCRRVADRDSIDVGAGVRAQLAQEGVEFVQVPGCTAESSDLFSYRRDNRTGRHGMIIVQ